SGGTQKFLNGMLTIQAESAQLTYKEQKYLKEEVVIPFLKITLKLRAQQNQFAIDTGEAMGRLVNAQLRGSIIVAAQTELNLNIILKPTNEFYEKYQDKDPKTLLQIAGVLQSDGRIEINIRGTLAQPTIEVVTVKPALPGAAPASSPASAPASS